jgi:hypothetical protein
MLKYLALAPLLFVISIAEAKKPVDTEFVMGSGFLRSSFGITVEFSVDVNQRDPDDPVGWMAAAIFSFPQHLFMTFESTGLTSMAVERRSALLTGTAMVVDSRSGFQGEVEFSAFFEDLNSNGRRSQNDAMMLTLFLPTGTEMYLGHILPGGIEVGTHR